MRTILAITLTLALVNSGTIADDLGVDVLRAKQAEERKAAEAIQVTITKIYFVEELIPLFKGGPKRGSEKIVELIGRNVPSLRGSSVAAFPTNLSVVVKAPETGHKDLAEYLAKLKDARKVLEESGFETVEIEQADAANEAK
jgi:hypothetical protein